MKHNGIIYLSAAILIGMIGFSNNFSNRKVDKKIKPLSNIIDNKGTEYNIDTPVYTWIGGSTVTR